MSYTPTTWQTGDTITATAMNKIENGIANAGGGTGGVIINDTSGTLDKTFAEIYDLLNNGTPCFIRWYRTEVSDPDEEYSYQYVLIPIVAVYKYNDTYRIAASTTLFDTLSQYFVGIPTIWTYSVTVSTGYPVYVGRVVINSNTLTCETTQYI